MIKSGAADESKPASKFDLIFFVFEICFLLAVFLSPFLFGSVDLWAFSLCIFLIALPAFLYWISFVQTGGGVYRTPLNKPLFVYLILFSLSVIFSKILYVSMVELFKQIAILAAFHATLLYCRDRIHTYRLAQALVITGTILSIIGILQLLGGIDNDWWHMPNYLSSTYVNHNHFAGLLVMLIPLSLGVVFAERQVAKKTLFGFMSIIMIIAFLFTISRGGMAALGAAVLFMLLVLKSQKMVRDMAPFILIGFLAIGGVVLFGTNPIEQRLHDIQDMTRPEELSLHMRLLTWQGTLNMIPQVFLLGTGPGTFGHLFLQFRPVGSSIRPVYTHNDFLNLFTDCGLLVFLAAAWVVWALFRHGFVIARRDESRMRMGLGAASMAGIFGLLVHGAFDFNFHIPANWLIAAVCTGILFSLDNDQFYPHEDKKVPLYKAAVSGISLVALGGCLYFGLSGYYYWEAKSLFKEKVLSDALHSVKNSLVIDAYNPEAHFLKGHIHRALARSAEQTQARLKEIELATGSFDKAIKLNPYEPMYDILKARTQAAILAENDPMELIRSYEKALAKDPNNPALIVMAVKDILGADPKKGDVFRIVAKQWLKKAIEMDPDQAETAFDLLWRHEKNVSSILSFYQEIPTGLKGLVLFLEKNDLWKQHRKYFLKMHGLDADNQKKKMSGITWNEKPHDILALKSFFPQGGGQVNYDDFFYENGELYKNINFRTPNLRLVLQAKATSARNTYPVLHVKIDDVVQDSLYLDSKEFKNYYVLLSAKPGFHRLTLQYVNDAQDKKTSADRNIWIKRIELQDPVDS